MNFVIFALVIISVSKSVPLGCKNINEYSIVHKHFESIKTIKATVSYENTEYDYLYDIGGENSIYKLIKKIGNGSYGTVYLATNLCDGKQVALKIQIIDARLAAGVTKEFHIAGIMKETAGSLILQHLTQGRMVAVFPLVYFTGEEAYHYFKKQNSKEELDYAIKAIELAVTEMHKLGINHLDLHLGNILYDDMTKTAHIIDFGFAEYGKTAYKGMIKKYISPTEWVCFHRVYHPFAFDLITLGERLLATKNPTLKFAGAKMYLRGASIVKKNEGENMRFYTIGQCPDQRSSDVAAFNYVLKAIHESILSSNQELARYGGLVYSIARDSTGYTPTSLCHMLSALFTNKDEIDFLQRKCKNLETNQFDDYVL